MQPSAESLPHAQLSYEHYIHIASAITHWCTADVHVHINCLWTPQVQFALWLMRYMGTGLLFFIGLKAPGLPRRPYMLLINEDERDVENSGQVVELKPVTLLFPNSISILNQLRHALYSTVIHSATLCSVYLRAFWAEQKTTHPPGRVSGRKSVSWFPTCGPGTTSSSSSWSFSAWGCLESREPLMSLYPFTTRILVSNLFLPNPVDTSVLFISELNGPFQQLHARATS